MPDDEHNTIEMQNADEDLELITHENTLNVSVASILDEIDCSPLQYRCIILLGFGNAADGVEVLAIGYILSVFNDPVSGKPIDSLPEWSMLLSSGVFVGMLFGGFLSGPYADRIGRRPVLILSLFVNGLAAFLSSLTLHLPAHLQTFWLVMFRIIGGIGVGSSVPSIFSMASEIVSGKHRAYFINIVACFWSVGAIYTALVAYLILGFGEDGAKTWPMFAFAVSLPGLVSCVGCWYLLEESPHYLWNKGRIVECRSTLTKFQQSKRHLSIPLRRDPILDNIERLNVSPESYSPTSSNIRRSVLSSSIYDLWLPSLRKKIVFTSLIFATLSFAYYGISSWISTLFSKLHFTDIYGTTIYYAAATIPGLAVAILFIDRVGRRMMLLWSMLGAFVSTLLIAFFAHAQNTLVTCTISAALFNACGAASWNALDIFSAELFPSTIRSTALGISSAAGRLGSIAGTIVNSVLIARVQDSVSYVLICAGISLIIGVWSTMILPDTRGS